MCGMVSEYAKKSSPKLNMPSQVPRCKVVRATSVKAGVFVAEKNANEDDDDATDEGASDAELGAATMIAVKLAGRRLGSKREDGENDGDDDNKATRAAIREDENVKLFLP